MKRMQQQQHQPSSSSSSYIQFVGVVVIFALVKQNIKWFGSGAHAVQLLLDVRLGEERIRLNLFALSRQLGVDGHAILLPPLKVGIVQMRRAFQPTDTTVVRWVEHFKAPCTLTFQSHQTTMAQIHYYSTPTHNRYVISIIIIIIIIIIIVLSLVNAYRMINIFEKLFVVGFLVLQTQVAAQAESILHATSLWVHSPYAVSRSLSPPTRGTVLIESQTPALQTITRVTFTHPLSFFLISHLKTTEIQEMTSDTWFPTL